MVSGKWVIEGGSMKVKVELHGHQYFAEHVGEVVQFCQTIENDGHGNYHQVPCLLLNDGREILQLSLKTHMTWSTVIVLDK
jgi:hypothetical protein